MQLPWKPWGETDFWLTQGFAEYRSRICPCGCGQWYADCTNPDLANRWQVETDTDYARAALDEWQKDNPDPAAGTMLSVRLLPEGEEAGMYDPERARTEYEAMRRRVDAMT